MKVIFIISSGVTLFAIRLIYKYLAQSSSNMAPLAPGNEEFDPGSCMNMWGFQFALRMSL